MRLNVFVAQATGLSRRKADDAIAAGEVIVNGQPALLGQTVSHTDTVKLHGQTITAQTTSTIMLHKPRDYVVSRDGQGSQTIYDLLPENLHHLKPVGRLDKDSSGLLLLTNDGSLTQTLTHPSSQKIKRYEVTLNKRLPTHLQQAISNGVALEDGESRLQLKALDSSFLRWEVTMHEGRNRQIRRTFEAVGLRVTALHRTHFGDYALGNLAPGEYKSL